MFCECFDIRTTEWSFMLPACMRTKFLQLHLWSFKSLFSLLSKLGLVVSYYESLNKTHFMNRRSRLASILYYDLKYSAQSRTGSFISHLLSAYKVYFAQDENSINFCHQNVCVASFEFIIHEILKSSLHLFQSRSTHNRQEIVINNSSTNSIALVLSLVAGGKTIIMLPDFLSSVSSLLRRKHTTETWGRIIKFLKSTSINMTNKSGLRAKEPSMNCVLCVSRWQIKFSLKIFFFLSELGVPDFA